MMPRPFAGLSALCLLAAPAGAQDAPSGDPAAGAAAFRQCVACHVVTTPEGETLAGRNARAGPNLYGVAGRPVGAEEDYRYGPGIEMAAEMGLTWTEENFVAYVQDPTGWLREATDSNRARGKMSYRVRSEADAVNLYAFLHALAPESGTDEGG